MGLARLWPRKTRFLRFQILVPLLWFLLFLVFFSIVLAYFTYTVALCTRLRRTEPVSPSFSPSCSLPQPRFRPQSRFRRPFIRFREPSRARILSRNPPFRPTSLLSPCWNPYETRPQQRVTSRIGSRPASFLFLFLGTASAA